MTSPALHTVAAKRATLEALCVPFSRSHSEEFAARISDQRALAVCSRRDGSTGTARPSRAHRRREPLQP